MVLVSFRFVCHAARPARCSFEGTYFEQVLRRDLCVGFLFFGRTKDPIFVAKWRHKFRQIAVENAKTQKAGRNDFAHSFVYKIPPLLFTAENAAVYLYIFFCTSHIALRAIVKVRIVSSKLGRNEQVCAHQKSYRK